MGATFETISYMQLIRQCIPTHGFKQHACLDSWLWLRCSATYICMWALSSRLQPADGA